MVEDRLDFDHLVRLVDPGEPDPPLDGPGLGDSGVVLQLLEKFVGGGGEILHHHVALHTVSLLDIRGGRKAGFFVAEYSIAEIVVSEGNEEGGGRVPEGLPIR